MVFQKELMTFIYNKTRHDAPKLASKLNMEGYYGLLKKEKK